MSLAHGSAIGKPAETTRDAFLGGRLVIEQPAKGFRAGLDSVLLGAAVGAEHGRLLELGAGVGTAALVALTYRLDLLATMVEVNAPTLALARENIAANGLSGRAEVVQLDVEAAANERISGGIGADAFAAVIANPPFYGGGTAPTPERAAARHMPAAALELWARAAATHAAADGEVIFIHLAEALAPLLTALSPRFGAMTVLPLTPREGEPAHRILIRGRKGSRAPLTLLASRALHGPEGRGFRPEFEAIFRGDDRLHW